MKKIVLISLITLLAACAKESDSQDSGRIGALQVSLSLGGGNTRSADDSIDDGSGNGYTLPFSAVDALTIQLYESLDQAPIFTHEATPGEIALIKTVPTGGKANFLISDIPVQTRHVEVLINRFAEANPDINHLQVTNRDTPPAPTMTRERIPYAGVTSEVTLTQGKDSITIAASVKVGPVLSRLEIKPGTIEIVDPSAGGYVFDWTADAAGKAKIKGFSAVEIAAAEASARENFRKQHNADVSGTAVYSYRVAVVRQTVTSGINDWLTSKMGFYVNYFKQHLKSADLVKNTNNNKDSWYTLDNGGTAEYVPNGAHSNLFDTFTAPLAADKVIAYHLFPQAAATNATLAQVKDGMPHVILNFTDTNTNYSRWLTIRAFQSADDNSLITSFKPGYCYSFALTDITLTPWSLALEVRVTDNTQTADSDPVIKDFDQTSNVPEPDDSNYLIELTVRQWRQKNIVTEF